MNQTLYALKGTIVHTPTPERFEILENGYLVCKNEMVEGVYQTLPEELKEVRTEDYTGKIIIPGMCDLHLHAPQYGFRGLGIHMDNDSSWDSWFEEYSFPEERHYEDLEYAKKAYEKFADDLMKTSTTRMSVFATLHRPATELLMEILANKGFSAFVGKLNMDRNSIDGLIETTETSLIETRRWLESTMNRYDYVKPIITPRYLPSCTDACMEGLQKLIQEFQVPVQSHLSEEWSEIKWAEQLKPEIDFYGQGYDMYDMLGSSMPSVMAHCVFPSEPEFELMAQRKNLWVAHCPRSNLYSSGSSAPVKRYLDAQIHVGLGSDMAAGSTINMFRIIDDALTASKIYWAANERQKYPDAAANTLSLTEAFYLATKGGSSLWGKAGSFETGYLFDAVIIDDTMLADFNPRTVHQRIERIVTRGDERQVTAKYINGKKIF